MGRLIHIEGARPSGAAHWRRVAAAVLAAALVGGGLAAWLMPVRALPPAPEIPTSAVPAPSAEPVRLAAPAQAVETARLPSEAVACPIQSMQIAVDDGAPQRVCIGATRVRQLGSVRTYEVQAGGVEGWVLQIDLAAGELVKAGLAARDGRRYACEAPQCRGLSLGRHDTRGVRSVSLDGLALTRVGTAGDTEQAARVSARLSVPSDEQMPGLACMGPSLSISAADGSLQKFCGQGGAGFEVADDGSRNFRFQDHEGQALLVAVSTDQRVTRVEFGASGCRGTACSGVTTSSAAPGNDLAERSFFFGRTVLAPVASTPGAAAAAAPLIVDGTLVMPAQE